MDAGNFMLKPIFIVPFQIPYRDNSKIKINKIKLFEFYLKIYCFA